MKTKQQKCSETQLGRVVVNNGVFEKRIYPDELDDYLNAGWNKGFKQSHKKELSDVSPRNAWNKGTTGIMKPNTSSFKKGNVPWNKGLTKETDDRVKKNTEKAQKALENNRINMPPRKMSEEHKKKISEATKGVKKRNLNSEQLKIKLTKDYLTRKKNNTFTHSEPEENLYAELIEQNKTKTIYRQYKEERYPFYCDFYIVEDDLFIELNAHWTHGGMPYDENNPVCQEKLAVWKEKAKTSNFYAQAIEIWTVRDVKKARIAKENNLNYKVIY